MTASSPAHRQRGRRAFLVQMTLLFVLTAGFGFLLQFYAFHESAQASREFAVVIAMVLVALQIGQRQGRRSRRSTRI